MQTRDSRHASRHPARRLAGWLLLILCGLLTPAQAAPPDRGLGINLHGIRYWSPTLPFADIFRQAGGWVPQRAGQQAWNTGETLDLDAEGWVRSLTPGQEAATVVATGGRYPAGRYRVTHDGEGELFLGLDARIVGKRGRDLLAEVKPKASVILKVMATNPANPVRNIRMYLPGIDPAKCDLTFNRDYLEYLDGFKVIRFMDWANTNLNDTSDWLDRTLPGHATQDRKTGVALEYMIQFAEELDANPWFNVPHGANDRYVREMAHLIKERVGPDRKIYVEYSNEVWNTVFPQYRYAAAEAARLRLADADAFYLRRALEVFRIFEEVFGGSGRIVRVLAGQAANTHRGQRLLSPPDIHQRIDAYAIAPYFGHAAQLQSPGDRTGPADLPVEEVMGRLDASLAETREIIRANVALARKAGVALIAYEGGQHVTNPPGRDDFCAAINRHPGMEALYGRYLELWERETGGALMTLFADLSTYGRSGCWGLSEFHGQALDGAPKLKAVRRHMLRPGAGR